MTCLDALEHVASVSEEADVLAAARLMRERGVDFLAVRDDRGRPVGTLTALDVAVRVCGRDLRASELPVRQAMRRDPAVCRPFDETQVAEELMERLQVSRVLVVGDDGELLGAVSLQGLAAARPARTDALPGPRELH